MEASSASADASNIAPTISLPLLNAFKCFGLSKSRRSQGGPVNCDIRPRRLPLSRGDNFDSDVSKDCKFLRFHVVPAPASARAIVFT